MIGKWIAATMTALTFLSLTMPGHAAAPPVKDKEYTLIQPALPPLEGADPKKIEVIEFFYYGCPHCYALQPVLKSWLKTAPKDVEFRRMPTIFRESWVPLTRTFYALEAIGALEKFHDDVFNTIHQQNVNLGDRKILLDWASRRGIDANKLGAAFDSFSVQTKAQRSLQLTRAYNITGTPSMVIGGRYLTGPSMTMNGDKIDYKRFIEVVNELITMARKAPPVKK